MTDAQTTGDLVPVALVNHMVDRFLSWRLPSNFSPDAGISFKPACNVWPTGTNLFDSTQAKAMVRYMVAGLPEVTAESELAPVAWRATDQWGRKSLFAMRGDAVSFCDRLENIEPLTCLDDAVAAIERLTRERDEARRKVAQLIKDYEG